jgi:3'(2'), 5'-bisphosphate nucleotidase
MDTTLEQMIAIAAEAAALVAVVYDQPFSVDYKGPADPVTEADRRANELICTRLRQAFPGVPIVAEESPEADWANFRSSERVFFVDPVDGTREFVARNGEFVVMIGLVEGDRATHGVVHAPVPQLAWAGSVREGAFEIDAQGNRTPLQVGVTTELAQASVVSSRTHRSRLLERALDELGAGEVLTLGSAGLKGVAVARGKADVYMAPEKAGSLWDACAPDAIVHAAGGLYTDSFGVLIDYRAPRVENERGIVAANPTLHDRVVQRLAHLER